MFEIEKASRKTKNITFLINSIKEVIKDLNIPKYCLLLGAGCYVSSEISTGERIIEILKKFIFANEIKIINISMNNLHEIEQYVNIMQNEFKEFVYKINRI